MTGQLLGDDSSVAGSPAYAFDNDTDTGMFRSGANTIGFSTSGTARVSISDAGLDVVNGLPIRLQDSSGAPFVALKSPSSVSSNVTFTLPGADGSNGQMLQTNGSGALSFTTVSGVPSGAVFCIAVATVPSGYLECDGAAVSRTTYAALFAVIGVNYGAGNGSSTFNIPDLRGEFVRGYDHGRGVDSGRSINNPQGSQNAQHNHSATTTGSVGNHRHNYAFAQGSNGGVGNNFGGSGITSVSQSGGRLAELEQSGGNDGQDLRGYTAETNDTTPSLSVSTTIANQGGNESRPRNIAMMYVIKF
jgi:microcystin-dependent protein